MPTPPLALTIAGSDCCGGAGLQADLKTFSAFGVHGLTAVTAVVAETPLSVESIFPVPPEVLQDQLKLLLSSYPVAAIKTGMLGSSEHIEAVADLLGKTEIPLVVDPVMVASTGHELSPRETREAYQRRLLPLATLVTPNLPEAKALADRHCTPDASSLASLLRCPVLLKGGHQKDAPAAIDVYADQSGTREYRAPWVDLESAHGTGCTLSAAITARLAWGDDLPSAIAAGKEFVHRALRESYKWSKGPADPELRAINQLPARFFGDSDTK